MGFRDGRKSPQFSTIFLFPPDNRQPHLSIPIDDVDIGYLYRELVYNRCLSVLKNEDEARDTAQDVFEKIQVLKSNGQFQVTYPKTFLSRAITTAGGKIYIAGDSMDSDTSKGWYWIHGEVRMFPDNGVIVTGIVVADEKVFVSGTFGGSRACYWVDGERVDLPQGRTANGIVAVEE